MRHMADLPADRHRASTSAVWGRGRLPGAPIATACGLVAATAYVTAVDPSDRGVFPACPFRSLTGWWCPGCGLTRATHHLMHGDLLGALRSHRRCCRSSWRCRRAVGRVVCGCRKPLLQRDSAVGTHCRHRRGGRVRGRRRICPGASTAYGMTRGHRCNRSAGRRLRCRQELADGGRGADRDRFIPSSVNARPSCRPAGYAVSPASANSTTSTLWCDCVGRGSHR